MKIEAPATGEAMATRTTTLLVDDIDGGEAVGTVSYSIHGVNYEIDLSETHSKEFEEVFAYWIEHSRRMKRGAPPSRTARAMLPPPPPSPSGQAAPPYNAKRDRSSITAFAAERGLPLPSDRGRIASSLIMAWNEAGSPRYAD
jgi:hypothetical protein